MEIPDIKQRLSTLAVLQHYGIKPDRNNQTKCPFKKTINQAAVFTPKQTPFIASAAMPQATR